MATNAATISTDEIYVGENTSAVLSDYLEGLESDVSGKAASGHSHSDLESAIEGLEDGKAEAIHTHEMSEINGLPAKLTEIEGAIADLQNSGAAGVTPMLVASMHLGKLDNNSGAENSSSTRICSDPFAVESGKSYWQVNDKGVNMYVLIYDAEEVFLEYMGSFASGAEIAVTNANAAYMRLGSLLGEYDLTNEFRIYNVDPESGESSTGDAGYSKDEADDRFALKTELHSHPNKDVLDGITAEKVSAWDSAASGSGSAGADGADGADGEDGGYYSIAVTQPTANTMKLSFTPSKEGMPAIPDQTVTLPAGEDGAAGEAGENGADGVSPAVSVSTISGGHRITITSASGTVSFDVMDGEDGADGQDGADGADGADFSGSLASDILRLNGTQALFKSSTMMTLGTNNLETMIAGSKIYSKVTISVSSDERLKEGIEAVDPDKCVDFINGINVKTFNYIGSDIPCMGVIAQDIQETELAKFFVSEMACPEKYLAVRASDMVFPLIVAVQELSKKVEVLLECCK